MKIISKKLVKSKLMLKYRISDRQHAIYDIDNTVDSFYVEHCYFESCNR